MSRLLLDTYRFLFARNFFYKFNKFLYKCSLSGLGVLNYQNDKISGEDFFLNFISDKNKNLWFLMLVLILVHILKTY
jgi:hypothetical protein